MTANVSIPVTLADFRFDRVPPATSAPDRSHPARGIGPALYWNPESGREARLWWAGLWVQAVRCDRTADWVVDYFDGCNEVGWIDLAFRVLTDHPDLTDWAEKALGGVAPVEAD